MLFTLLFISGFCAALIHLLFFRELLTAFQSLDIIAGFFAFHVILSFAAGARAGVAFIRSKKDENVLFFSICSLIILFVASLIFIYEIRNILNAALGGAVSLKLSFSFIFAAVFPVSFAYGFIFPMLAQFWQRVKKSSGLKFVFLFSAAGFVVGGLAYSLFLYEALSLRIAALIIILTVVSLGSLLKSEKKKVFLAAIVLSLLFLSDTDFIVRADKKLLEESFKPAVVKDYSNSAYGRTALAAQNNEYFLLSDNALLLSYPDNDVLNSEDFGHIPILHVKNPKNILVIGLGAKYLPMLLSYNVAKIDYVEPDAALMAVMKNNIKRFGYVFNDKRLRIHNLDARAFLKKSTERYDLILSGMPSPLNLRLNSFYTKEFFAEVKKRLAENGFFALKLPGRMAFSSFIMAEINLSVSEALQSVFNNVKIIPGTQNILIASDGAMPYRMHIKKRLADVQETTLVMSRYYLDDKMDTEKTRWLVKELKKVKNDDLLNADLNGRAMMRSFLHWQSGFSPYLSLFIDKTIRYSYLLIIAAAGFFFFSKSLYKTTSFTASLSAFWLLFAALFGARASNIGIFKWAAVFAALFVFGIISAYLCRKIVNANLSLNKRMFNCELFSILLIAFCCAFFKVFSISPTVLSFLVFGAGFAAAMEFLCLYEIAVFFGRAKSAAISLYAFAGAQTACLLGGSFLILAWGIEYSLFFIFFMKFLIFCRWTDIGRSGL
ncbi:MAG: hypothetical protein LBQ47_04450 [Endomicrobium sp.]|jgi:spermidine synthase|nr:hypothetical protein [Endomicrobium sp.]